MRHTNKSLRTCSKLMKKKVSRPTPVQKRNNTKYRLLKNPTQLFIQAVGRKNKGISSEEKKVEKEGRGGKRKKKRKERGHTTVVVHK